MVQAQCLGRPWGGGPPVSKKSLGGHREEPRSAYQRVFSAESFLGRWGEAFFFSVAPGRSHDHSEASLRPLRKGRGATPCERWPQRGFRTAFERNLRSSRKRKGKFRFRFPRAAQISSTNLPQTDSVRGKWCLKFAGVGIFSKQHPGSTITLATDQWPR